MALGVYHSLAAGKGYLEYHASLDSDRKSESEQVASRWVDSRFDDWDRTAWSGGAVPPAVAQVAEWVASAEYLKRSFAKNNPDGAELELPDALMTDAEKWTDLANQRGWVLDAGGHKQWKVDLEDGRVSPKTIRRVR